MTSIDLDHLLDPLSDEEPSGPNLDEDPAFAGLEVASTHRPETEVGGVVTPAEDPDWPAVQAAAVELLERSKDLQVAIILTEALTHNDGLTGLHAGLKLVHGFLESYWDDLHPALDHDDPDGAASMRVMRLRNLGDRARTVRALRLTPIVQSRFDGHFGLAEIRAIETADPETAEGTSERRAALENAFLEVEPEAFRETFASARSAAETLAAIETVVAEKSDDREELGFDGLEETLDEIQTLIEDRLSARGLSVEPPSDDMPEETAAFEEEDDASSDEAPQPPAAHAETMATNSAAITSREDAIQSLDRICRYFKQHEPSSPVPLLLLRAKHLIGRDFMEILEDITPDGVSDAERIAGRGMSRSGDEDDDD